MSAHDDMVASLWAERFAPTPTRRPAPKPLEDDDLTCARRRRELRDAMGHDHREAM